MYKLALAVGIDDYDQAPRLQGCEADANAVVELLASHEGGDPNFNCRRLISSEARITRAHLRAQAEELFGKKDADIALFFFAGHGAHSSPSGVYLVTQEGELGDEGIPLAQLVALANASPARERIIILDCCHAGGISELFGTGDILPLREGVAILAGCRDTESAVEKSGRGLFSSLVCDSLDGGAADVTGSVTVASIYAYVDEVLTGWQQRPLLQANLSKLAVIRRARAAVTPERLRRLVELFPSPGFQFQLDPSYEPTALPRNPVHEEAFGVLQMYRAARLVAPIHEEHMYYAAINSDACILTPLGKFYWHRVKAGKI